MVRNEQMLRDMNVRAKNGIKKYFRNRDDVKHEPIEFVCECSNVRCKGKVHLSIHEYEEIHRRKDRFVILPGHEAPKVEKGVTKQDRFVIVEKLALQP